MKKLLFIVLVCLVAVSPSVFAQRPERERDLPRRPGPNPEMMEAMQAMVRHERELEIREREMDLEEREIEIEFHKQMKAMELKKHEAELKMYVAKAGGETKKGPCVGKCGGGKCGSVQRPGSPCGPGKCGGRGCCGKKCKEMIEGLCLIMIVVHILLAVWVFKDIRKRNAGSGIWIVITLLTGVIGAALYLLARIGDARSQ